jgi:hypothetical protein
MFRRMVLKRGLDEAQRMQNAIKKRSIRITAKNTYWPFRDIVKYEEWCLSQKNEENNYCFNVCC